MRTFLIYALLLVGFIFLSYVLENGLIDNMYGVMTGETSSGSYDMNIEDINGRASNVNGYLRFKLKNTSENLIDRCYAQVDLYSKQVLLASTKYIEFLNMKPDEERDCQIKFKANEIESYQVSIVSELPDKSNIISILGWEFDVTNVFGMDFSNVKIFGKSLTDIFGWNNIQTVGSSAWSWIKLTLTSVPWWGYMIGGAIIAWYIPVGYLFGIFPL